MLNLALNSKQTVTTSPHQAEMLFPASYNGALDDRDILLTDTGSCS